MARSCANCIFSYVETRQTHDEMNRPFEIKELECRKGPPSASGHPKYRFPIVNKNIWCYEFVSLTEEDEYLKIDAEFEAPDWSSEDK